MQNRQNRHESRLSAHSDQWKTFFICREWSPKHGVHGRANIELNLSTKSTEICFEFRITNEIVESRQSLRNPFQTKSQSHNNQRVINTDCVSHFTNFDFIKFEIIFHFLLKIQKYSEIYYWNLINLSKIKYSLNLIYSQWNSWKFQSCF